MSEMKDSGIEWIGEIPADWETVPIRYLFNQNKVKNSLNQEKTALKFTYGTIIPKDNFDANTDEYVANTMANYTVVKPGMIMINCLNLNYDFVSQRIGLVKNNGAITSAYLSITPNERVNPEYANYQLKYWDSVKAFHNMGSGVRKTLDFSELGKKNFVLPSLLVQKNIVDYLNSRCAEIDALHADIEEQIRILEEYKKSVITEAVTKGLNPNIEMKDSKIEWIGMIPKDWEVQRGKYLFLQRNEKGNSYNLQLLSPTQKYGVIPQDKYEELSGMVAVKLNEKMDLRTLKTIHKGDYCISLRSFQGGFEFSEYEGVVSPAYQVFYPTKIVDRRYYKYLFKEQSFIEKMNSFTMSLRDGKNIAFADFGRTYIPVPPIKVQVEIADYIEHTNKEIHSIILDKQKQLETLDEYKKYLIFEYVTGKKEVKS